MDEPRQPPSSWPGLNEGLGLKLSAITHPSGEPQDTRRLVTVDEEGFGLARLKTEGEAFTYDIGGTPPPPLTPWQRRRRRLAALARRIRDIPNRVWWALFGNGDDYYDDRGW